MFSTNTEKSAIENTKSAIDSRKSAIESKGYKKPTQKVIYHLKYQKYF